MEELRRAIKKARKSSCTYRVVAMGFNRKGDLITIKTNRHNLDRPNGSFHAEEHIMKFHKNVRLIAIARVGRRQNLLPIDPCEKCLSLANKRQIKIVQMISLFNKKEIQKALEER